MMNPRRVFVLVVLGFLLSFLRHAAASTDVSFMKTYESECYDLLPMDESVKLAVTLLKAQNGQEYMFYDVILYSDTQCSQVDEAVRQVMEYQREPVDGPQEMYKVSYKLLSLRAGLLNADHLKKLNDKNVCGYSDWELGKSKNVRGCAAFETTSYDNGEGIYYGLFGLSDKDSKEVLSFYFFFSTPQERDENMLFPYDLIETENYVFPLDRLN